MSQPIRLTIGTLRLEGLSLTGAEAARLRRAMEGELTRLLTAGPPAALQRGGATPGPAPLSVGAAGVRERPEAQGVRIARAVFRGLEG